MENKVCIVGSGLVGSMLAAYLVKRGFEVDVYERRPDLRKTKISAGRSINLALSDRGWKALEGIGADAEVKKLVLPMHGRLMHDMEGKTEFMLYGKEGQYINSVSRGHLNMHLMSMAEQSEKVNIYFEMRCLDIDPENASITFKNEADGSVFTKSYDRIFGTDGAYSAVRNRLQRVDRFNYEQAYISSGYKEIEMPAINAGQWQMRNDALHIWPRKNFMLIALPNLDGSFTCTLFMPHEGEVSFEKLHSQADISHFFNTYFKDAGKLIPDLMNEWEQNATSSLMTVRCDPWNYKDKILLMGDAAHAIVPFYGQGMNAGFEDVRIFDEMLSNEKDWGKLFSSFSQLRKPDGDAILELALRNYVEMRDLVADPHFIKKRSLSAKIHQLIPEQWIPLYTMVTFSHIRYSDALRRGDEQNLILEQLVKDGISSASDDAGILRKLEPLMANLVR